MHKAYHARIQARLKHVGTSRRQIQVLHQKQVPRYETAYHKTTDKRSQLKMDTWTDMLLINRKNPSQGRMKHAGKTNPFGMSTIPRKHIDLCYILQRMRRYERKKMLLTVLNV